MMSTLLLVWSMLAIAVTFVGGLVLVIYPYGARWAGVVMIVLSAALGYVCVAEARVEWGGRRRRAPVKAQYAARTRARQTYAAPTSSPRRVQRPVSAEEHSGRHQRLRGARPQDYQRPAPPRGAHT
jgi:hypothetical protein